MQSEGDEHDAIGLPEPADERRHGNFATHFEMEM